MAISHLLHLSILFCILYLNVFEIVWVCKTITNINKFQLANRERNDLKDKGIFMVTFWSTVNGIVSVPRHSTALESPQLDVIIWQPDKTATTAVDPTISGATATVWTSLSALSKLVENATSHLLCHPELSTTSRPHSSAITPCILSAQKLATYQSLLKLISGMKGKKSSNLSCDANWQW